MHNPEYRLTSRSGQDRSVKRKIYARTTDKGNEYRWIYSLLLRYNKTKRRLTHGTQKKFMPKLYDNIFDSNPLLMRMKKGDGYKKIDGGERIIVPLEYAQATAAGTYSGADVLSTTDNEVFSAAEYTWKQYYAKYVGALN